jgi:hypothetical protein
MVTAELLPHTVAPSGRCQRGSEERRSYLSAYEHPRYWGALKLVCARVLISLGALLLSGWWSARRIPDPA